MQDDLIERLRGFALRVSEGINEACEEATAAGEADNARIAALETDNALLMGLVKEAGEGVHMAMLELGSHGACPACINAHSGLRATIAKIKEATDAE